jgi:hypothetical protein
MSIVHRWRWPPFRVCSQGNYKPFHVELQYFSPGYLYRLELQFFSPGYLYRLELQFFSPGYLYRLELQFFSPVSLFWIVRYLTYGIGILNPSKAFLGSLQIL